MASNSFTDEGEGDIVHLTHISGEKIEGEDLLPITYTLSGTFVATLQLQYSPSAGRTWKVLLTTTTAVSVSNLLVSAGMYRWVCTDYTSGTAVTTVSQNHYTIESWKSIAGATVAKITDEGLSWEYISNVPYGALLGRCLASDGNAQIVNIGNGLGMSHDEETDECTLTIATGFNSFVRNVETDTTFTVPPFITLMKYQCTGGGASGFKPTNLALSCSGGSGETQIGSLTVAAGDTVRVIIPAAVGASLTTDAANIAGGDVEIRVNGVTKVLAKGGPGGLTSSSTSTTFAGGSGGTTPAGMARWDGGVGRRDSAGTAFGAGVRGEGSGCGGNVSSASGAVTAAGCGFVIISY